MASLHKENRHIWCEDSNVWPAGDHKGKQVIYSLFSHNSWYSSILGEKQNKTKKTTNHTSAYRQNFVLNRNHRIVGGCGVLLSSLLFYVFASADFDAPVHPLGIYSFSCGHQLWSTKGWDEESLDLQSKIRSSFVLDVRLQFIHIFIYTERLIHWLAVFKTSQICLKTAELSRRT